MENKATNKMKRGNWMAGIALIAAMLVGSVAPANAQLLGGLLGTTQPPTRLIVRDNLGLLGILNSCLLLGCTVQQTLDGTVGQLFLVTAPATLSPLQLISGLVNQLGVVDVELDQVVQTSGATAGPAPSYLTDKTPVAYYGTTVWHGYVAQPATQLIRNDATHSTFQATGSGVLVADIDTGVDPTHPALKYALVTGYDFTRNTSGGSELPDYGSTSQTSTSGQAAQVNQSTVAVLDQSTVAVLDGSPYAAFGHGTMTAGLIHLVAPNAKIMPLKAFKADGSGYNSDILRAIYYASQHGARVLNMSFNYTAPSNELAQAINYAALNGAICVASAGNSGLQTVVYPGGYKNVIDVASTSNTDIQSSFTNYGAPPVWLAAPGEGVVTLYPFGTYAAGWGTSFSTPLVSGTAALLVGANPLCTFSCAANAVAHADPISNPQLGHGRLDSYSAVQSLWW
jgi:subtilisin family serine protease